MLSIDSQLFQAYCICLSTYIPTYLSIYLYLRRASFPGLLLQLSAFSGFLRFWVLEAKGNGFRGLRFGFRLEAHRNVQEDLLIISLRSSFPFKIQSERYSTANAVGSCGSQRMERAVYGFRHRFCRLGLQTNPKPRNA